MMGMYFKEFEGERRGQVHDAQNSHVGGGEDYDTFPVCASISKIRIGHLLNVQVKRHRYSKLIFVKFIVRIRSSRIERM
jgi:hypothetical protein